MKSPKSSSLPSSGVGHSRSPQEGDTLLEFVSIHIWGQFKGEEGLLCKYCEQLLTFQHFGNLWEWQKLNFSDPTLVREGKANDIIPES